MMVSRSSTLSPSIQLCSLQINKTKSEKYYSHFVHKVVIVNSLSFAEIDENKKSLTKIFHEKDFYRLSKFMTLTSLGRLLSFSLSPSLFMKERHRKSDDKNISHKKLFWSRMLEVIVTSERNVDDDKKN
jgi:hypothetical protein